MGICFFTVGAAGVTEKMETMVLDFTADGICPTCHLGSCSFWPPVGQTITDPTYSTVMRVVEFIVMGVAIWWIVPLAKIYNPALD